MTSCLLLHFTWIKIIRWRIMNFKTPLCSHIHRFMVIVSKMRDGKYISLCYKISVFYFERVFHSFLMSQAPESYIIEYPLKELLEQEHLQCYKAK